MVAVACLATVGAGTFTALSKSVTITVDGQQRHVTTLAGTVSGALATAGLSVGPHDTLAPAGASGISDGSQIVLETASQVTLAVDGASRQMWTTARTVAGVLAANDLTVGAHDTVAPDTGTALSDGSLIVLDRGRPLTLTIDGQQRQVWTTARTVEQALTQLGTRADEYQLSADRSRQIPLDGLSVTAQTLRTVSVIDGPAAPQTLTVPAKTVADLLAGRQITLGRYDSVTPSPGGALTDGETVRIDRGSITLVQRTESVPQPDQQSVQDDQLDQGTTAIAAQGHPGEQSVTYQVTTVNGAVLQDVEIARTTVTQAVPTLVHVGTRPLLDWVGNQVFFHDTTFGVNWDGLAMCESTHNPKAINANPSAGLPTYGLFQFDLPTWRSVGGSGNPIDASPQEQIMRAKLLYQKRGLEPWACAYAAH